MVLFAKKYHGSSYFATARFSPLPCQKALHAPLLGQVLSILKFIEKDLSITQHPLRTLLEVFETSPLLSQPAQ